MFGLTALLPWWWRWAGLALIVVGSMGYGWMKGDQHGTKKLTDFQGQQAIAAQKIITRHGEITERVVMQYRDRVVKGDTITKTIEKKVTEYVESKPLALSCMLDSRWVRLHDAAAIGEIPDSAANPAGGLRAPTANREGAGISR